MLLPALVHVNSMGELRKSYSSSTLESIVDSNLTTTSCKNSHISPFPPIENVPVVDSREIVIGHMLGEGNFCEVHRIKGFCQIKLNKSENAGENLWRNSSDVYALKTARKSNLHDIAKHALAISDLLNEAEILAQVNHAHIIRLLGVVSGSCSLILDRLAFTLQQVLSQWSQRRTRQQRLRNRLLPGSEHRSCDFLQERITFATQLASAVSYLHGKHIVHRDLKPSNIGFDDSGTIKIIDFGLSKKLHNNDDEFLRTVIGSPRFMAPEILGRVLPYSEVCDTYSFSIILWEMLTCQRAFADALSAEDMRVRIWLGSERPSLEDDVWSKQELRDLVTAAWDANPPSRPSMEQVHQSLKKLYE